MRSIIRDGFTFLLQGFFQFFDFEPLHFYYPGTLLLYPIDFLLKQSRTLLVPFNILFTFFQLIEGLLLFLLLV